MKPIILRASIPVVSANATVKSLPLTNAEIDNNFALLNIGISELSNTISGLSATTYGGTSSIPVFTVNNQGRITSAANVSVSGISGFSNNGAGNAGFTITTSAGSSFSANLPTSGVSATTYGGSTQIPVVVVDTFGRITSASNTSITTGTTLVDQTSSSTTHFLILSSASSGSISGANVSTSKLYFIPSTGTLYSTVFQSLSDKNLKNDIITIDNPWSVLDYISGYNFYWKDNGQKSSGVIAQELENFAPHLVSIDEHNHRSVNYHGLIAYLIESVKNLNQRVRELEGK